ncbi:Rieske 2Fe-2S domain-containing protein [Streptomyces sp. NPDC127084]|uniref:Rieske (2Fe-2S) protein n=1 Tax=Streptomyces sp. NPDC127084 TaxID=3347133 RepID=UPI0036678114
MSGSQGPAHTVARRTVVTAAGGAGMCLALTACGGANEPGAAGEPAADQGTKDPGGSTGGGGDSGGKVLARTADIPEGGGKVIGDVVVTQPKAGQFKAFSAKCTHQGCSVKDVSENMINCPCHNSLFDASDGRVHKGPATTPLPPAPIVVDGDTIRLA